MLSPSIKSLHYDPPSHRIIYRSGGWEIDFGRRELRSDNLAVPIGGRAFDILLVLVQSAGQVVTKDALMASVWPDAIIEENTLQVHISAVRKALGADRGLLKTYSGRGYRLLGSWISIADSAAPTSLDPVEPAYDVHRAFRTNIPPNAPDLIGRGGVVEQIEELLSAYRIVTLTGPGGIGKTALALEVARTVFPAFQGDCWVTTLDSISDPRLVPSAIASAIGFKLAGDEISAQAVAHAIGRTQLLLVLDNCEHVIDAAAQLAETFTQLCPRVTILATSREVLRIAGEHVYRVPALDAPGEHQVEPTDILHHSSVQLFIARAQALHPSLSLQAENLLAVGAICRRLDGIPLAIEIAAARTATLGPQQVAAFLVSRLSSLSGGRRTALARQKTLQATLDWSYALLQEPERVVLQRLALFASWFTLDAAIAVVSDQNIEPDSLINAATELLAKSLLSADLSQTQARYRLLDTTRVYAREKLSLSDDGRRVAQRHISYLIKVFEDATTSAGNGAKSNWPADFGAFIDDLRMALKWAFGPKGDIGSGISLTIASVPLWIHLSLLDECRGHVETALSKLQGDDKKSHQALVLLASLAMSRMYIGSDMTNLNEIWADALSIAERLGVLKYRLRSLWGLSSCHLLAGQVSAALSFAEKYQALALEIGEFSDQHIAERLVGQSCLYLGDLPAAQHHLERVLNGYVTPCGTLHVLDQRVMALSFLSRTLWLLGKADQAVSVMHEAIEYARSSENALSLCMALSQSACHICRWIGDTAAFEAYTAELVAQSKSYGLTFMNVPGRCYEALLMVERGQMTQGLAYFDRAFFEFRRTSIGLFRDLYCDLAKVLGDAGQFATARQAIDEAQTHFEKNEERWLLAECIRIKAELLLKEDPAAADEVERLLLQSLHLAHRQGALSWQLRTAMSLARLQRDQGRVRKARDRLVPIYESFREGFATADLVGAKLLIEQLN